MAVLEMPQMHGTAIAVADRVPYVRCNNEVAEDVVWLQWSGNGMHVSRIYKMDRSAEGWVDGGVHVELFSVALVTQALTT